VMVGDNKTANQTKADRMRRVDSNNIKIHSVTTNIPWASVLHSDPRGKETHTRGPLGRIWDGQQQEQTRKTHT